MPLEGLKGPPALALLEGLKGPPALAFLCGEQMPCKRSNLLPHACICCFCCFSLSPDGPSPSQVTSSVLPLEAPTEIPSEAPQRALPLRRFRYGPPKRGRPLQGPPRGPFRGPPQRRLEGPRSGTYMASTVRFLRVLRGPLRRPRGPLRGTAARGSEGPLLEGFRPHAAATAAAAAFVAGAAAAACPLGAPKDASSAPQGPLRGP
ncbi:hypothetical protein Efla_007897 [Eimeria flavescens]